jgi:O-antigen ligase
MLAALAAYTDHPVLGVGPGQYAAYHSVRYQGLPEVSFREIPIPRRAHSLYLEIAAETGTVGLTIFMAIPLLLLMDLGRLRRALFARRPDLARLAASFTLMLLAYLGTGVFLHLAFERYYWVMIALAASVVGALERAAAQEAIPC